MTKRAALYIRTSTERQGEKASPEFQESDCREYCQIRDYQVVEIYKDIYKYRSGSKLVEPSGTRSDRPEMRRMLRDAAAGNFDLIVAWREDRLYRGLRPMLDVIDCIEKYNLDIELVKETFDKRMAPIKASIGRMELEGRQDRITSGISSRIDNGKIWSSSIPYGYQKNEGRGEVNEREAEWVRNIWTWHGSKIPILEIRRRLIEGGAPQRNAGNKIPWQIPFIYQILKNPIYINGIQLMEWDGKTHEIKYPVLIDPITAQMEKERKEKNKANPARHLKHNYLGLSFVTCAACGQKMSSYTSRAWHKNYYVRVYRCGHSLAGYPAPGCCKRIKVNVLDEMLWGKVWFVLNNPEIMETGLKSRIDELRAREEDAEKGIERIQRELENLMEQRRWVITQARKKAITEEDMNYQLGQLDYQEKDLRRELTDCSLLIGNRAEKLMDFAENYRQNFIKGMEWLNSTPRTPEEEEAQFIERRRIVEAIVKRVNVYEDKSIKVDFEFDLSGDEEIKTSPLLWR